MDITDVVCGLSCAAASIICFAWDCRKELKDRGTGAAVAILLSAFIIFFCVVAKAHNIIGT